MVEKYCPYCGTKRKILTPAEFNTYLLLNKLEKLPKIRPPDIPICPCITCEVRRDCMRYKAHSECETLNEYLKLVKEMSQQLKNDLDQDPYLRIDLSTIQNLETSFEDKLPNSRFQAIAQNMARNKGGD